MKEHESEQAWKGRLEGLEREVGALRGEVRSLGDEIRALRRQMRLPMAWHPALLFLVLVTFGFILAVTLTSGIHWLLSVALALAASLLVLLLFRRRGGKSSKADPS